MAIRIRHVYGPHWFSLTSSYTVFVDVIGFPRKCVYDCIYCPVSAIPTKTIQPSSLVPPENILQDFKWFMEHVSSRLGIVTFYGTGDPWLNPWLPLVIDKISSELGTVDKKVMLYAVTTGHLLSRKWSLQVLEKLDKIYIRVDGFGEDYLLINNPHPEAKLKKLIEVIRNISREYGSRKLGFILTLVEVENSSNAGIDSLEQVTGFLSMVRAEEVFLKTVHRPPRNTGIKPVSKKKIMFAKSFLEEKGFSVYVEQPMPNTSSNTACLNEELLYNHLLRKPLTLKEISIYYGLRINTVAHFLNSLMEKGLVEKISWRTGVFYRGVVRIK